MLSPRRTGPTTPSVWGGESLAEKCQLVDTAGLADISTLTAPISVCAFNFPVSAWALPAAPPHCRSPLTVPRHLWQFRRSSSYFPLRWEEFNQMRCLMKEARHRTTEYHYLFKVGRKVYIYVACVYKTYESHTQETGNPALKKKKVPLYSFIY